MTTRLALCPQVLFAVPAHGRRWRGCYWAWTHDGPFRWRGQSRECERHLVGVRSMFQVHDRRHVLGGTYGVYRFSSFRAMEGVRVDVADGHRGSVRASTHQVGKYINGVHTPFGRWMARRKRCARLVTLVVSFLFLRQESSYIARICHYLENCLSTSRHFSLTAIIVSSCVSIDRRTLLIHPSSPILYLYRRRLPTGSCPWFLFKGNFLDSLI